MVVFARDVVATAKVNPFHLRKEFAEVPFEFGKDNFECVGILFAKRMEMEPFDTVKEFGLEFDFGYTETGVLAAGVVNIGLDGRVFRIHADAGTHAVG